MIKYTSLRRDGSLGRAIKAMPLQTTAMSSTKTQSGEFSSGGISTTSMSSSRRSCARARCCVLASSNVTSPRVRSDNGILHRIACVYRCSGMLVQIYYSRRRADAQKNDAQLEFDVSREMTAVIRSGNRDLSGIFRDVGDIARNLKATLHKGRSTLCNLKKMLYEILD